VQIGWPIKAAEVNVPSAHRPALQDIAGGHSV